MAKFPRGSTHAHFPRGHRRLWGLVSNPEPNLSPCRADMNKDLKAFLARWDLAQDCAGSFKGFQTGLRKISSRIWHRESILLTWQTCLRLWQSVSQKLGAICECIATNKRASVSTICSTLTGHGPGRQNGQGQRGQHA